MMTSAAKRRLIGVRFAALLYGPAVALIMPDQAYGAAAQPAYAKAAAAGGTLPLFAALALGVGVAVLAVIAFLQMTKGRNAAAMAGRQESRNQGNPRSGPRHVPLAQSPVKPVAHTADHTDASYKEEGDAAESDGMSPDHTIPLPRNPKGQMLQDANWRGIPRIYGLEGEFAGESFRVSEEGLSIGRDPACHIVYPSAFGEISRRHCTIRYDSDSGTFFLMDHGSSNGTFFTDGEKLVPGRSYPLKAGDRFMLSGGSHWFEIRD